MYKQRARILRNEILKHNELYYQKDAPIIPDSEYDKLYQELQTIESAYPELLTSDSPTQLVGAKVAKGFVICKHREPMLSIKTETDYSEKGAHAFHWSVVEALGKDAVGLEYVGEPKYDGMGINLQFHKGLLVKGITRGDGFEGEDVTANVKCINDIPHVLAGPSSEYPEFLEVRGEIYMSKDVFKELNESLQEKGQKTFANPRNAAAGSVRQKFPAITSQRKLNFVAYGIGVYENWKDPPTSQIQLIAALGCLGFPSNFNMVHLLKTPEDLAGYHSMIATARNGCDYELDGVVYKVNDFAKRELLGFRSREPRWAVAHKYPAETAMTEVLDIVLQVGRTGVLTPVAKLDPIRCGGVIVSSALLSNQDIIDELDIGIGDTVVIQRNGDVVPGIVSVVKDKRKSGHRPFKILERVSKCPVCDSPLLRIDGEVAIRCTGGFGCSAQRKRALEHFVSRNGMNIKGFGEQTVSKLVDLGLLKYPSDIYEISINDYQRADLSHKETMNLLLALHEAMFDVEPWKLIHALGIPTVGETTAKILAKHCNQLSSLKHIGLPNLLKIKGIGPKTANSIHEYFFNPNTRDILDDLLSKGIMFKESVQVVDSPFTGKTVVVTGTHDGFTRETIKEKLESLGAIVSNAITSKTDYLIAGENAGSKLEKARNLGIHVLDTEGFKNLLL